MSARSRTQPSRRGRRSAPAARSAGGLGLPGRRDERPALLQAPEAGVRARLPCCTPPTSSHPAERARLAPHVTHLDGPVFGLVNLPETVKGALFARYSRYPGTLRRLFLDEFADSLPEAAPATTAPRARGPLSSTSGSSSATATTRSPSSAAPTSPASGPPTS